MKKIPLLFSFSILPLFVAACDLPSFSSIKPGVLVPETHTFICGEWKPVQPVERRVVVDVFLNKHDFYGRPRMEDVDSILKLGGMLRYQFNVGVVRTDMDATQVPYLMTGTRPMAFKVQTVSDLANPSTGIYIVYNRPITQQDSVDLTTKGVHIFNRWHNFTTAYAPDAAIPQIRAMPTVNSVNVLPVYCLS